MLMMTQKQATNRAALPILPVSGTSAYIAVPSAKKTMYVGLRPILSDSEAQPNRPAMLKMLSRPTKPAAALGVIFPLNISWIIADAWPSTPIPAVTLKQRTTQSSQNCGVLIASPGVTLCCVISVFAFSGGGTQPAGFQPSGGTR